MDGLDYYNRYIKDGHTADGGLEGGAEQHRQGDIPEDGVEVDQAAGGDLQDGELRLQDPEDIVQAVRLPGALRHERVLPQRADDLQERLGAHLRAEPAVGRLQVDGHLPRHLQLPQEAQHQQLRRLHLHQQGRPRAQPGIGTLRAPQQAQEAPDRGRGGPKGDIVLLHVDQRLVGVRGLQPGGTADDPLRGEHLPALEPLRQPLPHPEGVPVRPDHQTVHRAQRREDQRPEQVRHLLRPAGHLHRPQLPLRQGPSPGGRRQPHQRQAQLRGGDRGGLPQSHGEVPGPGVHHQGGRLRPPLPRRRKRQHLPQGTGGTAQRHHELTQVMFASWQYK